MAGPQKRETSTQVAILGGVLLVGSVAVASFLYVSRQKRQANTPHIVKGLTWNYQTRMLHPDIQLMQIENFLSETECKHLIDIANKIQFQPSPLAVIDREQLRRIDSSHRNSSTCFLPHIHDDRIVDDIENRVLSILHCDDKYDLEQLQVVRYKCGEEFKAHHDWFSEEYLKHNSQNRQRRFTFFVYLNDVPPGHGGQTVFPELDNLTVAPKQGTSLFWENCDTKCLPHSKSLHQGLPITQPGTVKYGLNIWVSFPRNGIRD